MKTVGKPRKKQETKTKSMLLKLDLSLYSELSRIAEEEDRSITGQVVHSIRESINKKQLNK